MAIAVSDPWRELANLQRDVNELFSRADGGSRGIIARGLGFRGRRCRDRRGHGGPYGAARRAARRGRRVGAGHGMLTISGERRKDPDVEGQAWIRRERPVGQFQRSFSLPQGTDPEEISASFDHGLLELRVPHPPERTPHRVQVTAGDTTQEAIDVG